NPEKITGFISQNGNAYEEGLGTAWDAVKRYWISNSEKDRDALRGFVKEQELRFQYFTGVDNPELIAPEAYTLDQHFLDRPDSDENQLDLLYDYQHNVEMYPQFHEYFRKHQPKALIVWGIEIHIFYLLARKLIVMIFLMQLLNFIVPVILL